MDPRARAETTEDVEELRALLASPHREEVSRAASQNPALPEDLCARLAALKRDEPLPEQERFALAALGPWPRVWVIQAHGTPPALLPRLFDGTMLSAIRAVQRRDAPADFLRQIEEHPWPDRRHGLYFSILQEIAAHPNLPEESPQRLAETDEPPGYFVLSNLAKNPRTPRSVLESLWRRYQDDPTKDALGAALASNPRSPIAWASALRGHPVPWVRAHIAQRPDLPAAEVEPLSRDPESAVRYRVSVRPALPEEILVRLAEDPSRSVREALAMRSDLPPQAATRLLEDPDRAVRAAVTSRAPALAREARALRDRLPSCSEEERADFAARGPLAAWDVLRAPSTSTALRLRLAEGYFLFSLIASDESLSPRLLDELSRSPRGKVRVAVAYNPNTAPETLARLAHDPTKQVQRALRRRRDESE